MKILKAARRYIARPATSSRQNLYPQLTLSEKNAKYTYALQRFFSPIRGEKSRRFFFS